MTDSSGPFDNSTWSETEWARHMLPAMPSGVIDVPAASYSAGGLALLTSGLNWGLDQGRANVGGFGFYRTGAQTANQAITANTNSTLYRRDRVVLRRSLATNTVVPVRLQGTAAASPVAPVLTQNDTTWELPMFSFLVPPASGTILSGFLDERIWLSPTGYASAAGLLGHDLVSPGSPTILTTSSTTSQELMAGLRSVVYLQAGRAYEYLTSLRCYGDTVGTQAGVTGRITAGAGTPAAGDPGVAGDSASIETAGVAHLYPLRPRDTFQVSTSGVYTFSLWGNRISTTTGNVSFYVMPTGAVSHEIRDVGVALPTVPQPI